MNNGFVKLIIPIVFITLSVSVFAYDNLKTHPDLTDAAIDLYQKSTSKQLSDKQRALIVQGSVDEDADPRYIYHFYDPVSGNGLAGNKSSKEWAQNQGGLVGATGDYSEEAILTNYRDGTLIGVERAYQGIGHMLHLIQDMSVPAHVKLDSHPKGDVYEEWSHQNGVFDSRRGEMHYSISLESSFEELSRFTEKNFFSKNTVNVKRIGDFKISKELVDNKVKTYFINKVNGHEYRVVYSKNADSLKPEYLIDNDFKLNLDYWNMLSPMAVGYSAGVIDYFVKKFEEIDKQREGAPADNRSVVALFVSDFWSGLKYAVGDMASFGGSLRQDAWGGLTSLAANTWQQAGFFGSAVEENVIKVADTALESGKKAADATEKTAKKVTVTTSDLVKKTADQSKVLGQKIIKMAVKPAQAAAKKPPLKLPSAPIKPVVTITPIKPLPVTPEPVIVLPPSGSSTDAGVPPLKDDEFLLVFSNGTSLPEQARAHEVPTGTDLIITPPATTSPTSTDATATTTEPTSTSTAPAHVVISEIYASENNSGSEWVELYNPTDESVDLSGWKLDTQFDNDGDAILSDGSTIDPQGYYLIGDQSSGEWRPDSRNWPKPDFYNGAITLTDYDGWVRLRTASGTIVDAVGWGETSVYEANALSSEEYDRALSFKRRGLIDNVSVLDSDDNQADFAIESDPYPDRHAPTCVEISSEEGVITDGQLTAEQGTYCVTSWLTVAEGDSLMVEPGVIVKFAPNIGLNIEGELSAIGTQEDKVYFTSIYDDIGGKVGGWTKETLQAGEWANLQFTQESAGNFDWAVIRYGGTYGPALARTKPYSFHGAGPRLAAIAPVASTDVAVIHVSAAAVNIDNSVIKNNIEGVEVLSGGTATVANSQFIGNGKGYVNSTDQEQVVTDNFWGASSGPLHDQLNPGGEGDSVTGLAIIEPWLSDAPFTFY